jgi:hypothetical protein
MNFIPGMQGVAGLMRTAANPTPTFGAAGTFAAGSSGADLTPAFPGGHAAADFDLLFAFAHTTSGGPPTINTPSGWTLLTSIAFNTNATRLAVFYKDVTGAESAPTVSFVAGPSYYVTGAVIISYRGVAAVGSIEAAATGSTAGSTTPALISTTTLGGNRRVINAMAQIANSTGTPASGWTERVEQNSFSTVSLYIQDYDQVAAGATPGGTYTVTAGGANGSIVCALYG